MCLSCLKCMGKLQRLPQFGFQRNRGRTAELPWTRLVASGFHRMAKTGVLAGVLAWCGFRQSKRIASGEEHVGRTGNRMDRKTVAARLAKRFARRMYFISDAVINTKVWHPFRAWPVAGAIAKIAGGKARRPDGCGVEVSDFNEWLRQQLADK